MEEQFKRINDKLQQLLKQHLLLQKENEKLKEELQEKKLKIKAQQDSMESMEQKVAVLKKVTGQLDESDKRDLEKRLNLYLKELDHCIGSLSE